MACLMAVALTVTIGRGAGGEEIERDLVSQLLLLVHYSKTLL